MPLISVIVPVYKVEPYLRRCVDSILAQTFRDFELILVDDGSPDNCGAICDEYAAADTRVHVIHQANGGLSAARNAGLDWMFAHSSSEYLAFVDSDDWVAANYLAELHKGCQLCDVACVDCQLPEDGEVDYELADGIKWRIRIPAEYWRKGRYPVTAWGKLYKRHLFVDVRYPVGKIYEDVFVTHRVLFSLPNVAHAKVGLYFYLRRNDSITREQFNSKRLDFIDAKQDQVKMFDELGLTDLANAERLKIGSMYTQAIKQLGETQYRKPLAKLLRRSQVSSLVHADMYRAAHPIRSWMPLALIRLLDAYLRKGFWQCLKRVFLGKARK